jgi:plastocyanin
LQHRSRARLATVLVLIASLAGLTPSGAAASTRDVTMDFSYSFHPGTRTIARGDKVKWKVTGLLQHDVASTLPGYFRSPGGTGGLHKGDTYTKTFPRAGTFGYLCRFHRDDGMTGTITVPLKVTLSGGTFKIVVASTSTSGKWRSKIQVRKPGSSWKTLTTTSAASVTYGPSKVGTYQFRSAVKNHDTGATSSWSPVVSRTR